MEPQYDFFLAYIYLVFTRYIPRRHLYLGLVCTRCILFTWSMIWRKLIGLSNRRQTCPRVAFPTYVEWVLAGQWTLHSKYVICCKTWIKQWNMPGTSLYYVWYCSFVLILARNNWSELKTRTGGKISAGFSPGYMGPGWLYIVVVSSYTFATACQLIMIS